MKREKKKNGTEVEFDLILLKRETKLKVWEDKSGGEGGKKEGGKRVRGGGVKEGGKNRDLTFFFYSCYIYSSSPSPFPSPHPFPLTLFPSTPLPNLL